MGGLPNPSVERSRDEDSVDQLAIRDSQHLNHFGLNDGGSAARAMYHS